MEIFASTTLLKFYTFFHWCLVFVNAECTLSFPQDRWSTPIYEKSFGTRTVKVSFLNDQVRLEEGQNLTGTCDTHFNGFSYNYKYIHEWTYYGSLKREEKSEPREISGILNKISLVCVNEKLRYDGYDLLTPILCCAHLNWKIYESETPLPWCDPTSESYILGTISLAKDVKLATACFDLETSWLKSVRYFAGPVASVGNYSALFASVPLELNELNLNMEIKYFDNTFSDLSKSAIKVQNPPSAEENIWLRYAANTYEKDIIVQGGVYAAFIGKFRQLFEIYWWSPLRLGNWKRFTEALDKQASSKVYNLHAGTLGVVTIPFGSKCAHENAQKLRLGTLNKTVPAYIWTYVEAVDGSDNFVIVAYNSPFFEFFPEENTIFCKDICNKIDWLKDIRATFRSATLGVIFCCSPNEVRKHGYLDGFPRQVTFATETDTTLHPFDTTALSMESTTNSALSEESIENVISKRETETKNQNEVRVTRKIVRKKLERKTTGRLKRMSKKKMRFEKTM